MSFFDQQSQEEQLNPLQQALYDKFVDEFLYDNSIYLAAMRCGFNRSYARQYGEEIFHTAYVQNEIKRKREAHFEKDEKKRIEEEKIRVKSLLLRMAETPHPAAQVAAAGKLAAILGMNAPIRTEQTMRHTGGVMRIPAIADIEAWEQAAEQSQMKLQNETRE